MNKKGYLFFILLFCIIAAFTLVAVLIMITPSEYKYVGTIVDMEGGTSRSVLILELDTIGKTPYTTAIRCSNKIRIGHKVYSKSGFFGESSYLWVKYADGKYC